MLYGVVGKNGNGTFDRNSAIKKGGSNGMNLRSRFGPRYCLPRIAFALGQEDFIRSLRCPTFQVFANTSGVRLQRFGRTQNQRASGSALDIDSRRKKPERNEFRTVSHRIKSEEHTSELQSHSFISYAVFCLKKKKDT